MFDAPIFQMWGFVQLECPSSLKLAQAECAEDLKTAGIFPFFHVEKSTHERESSRLDGREVVPSSARGLFCNSNVFLFMRE